MRKANHGGFVYWRLVNGELLQLRAGQAFAGQGPGLKEVVGSAKRLIEQDVPGRQERRPAIVRASIDGRRVRHGPRPRKDCRIQPLKAYVGVDGAESNIIRVDVTKI